MKQNKKGFTLVELLGVIAILAILMLLVTPRVIESFNKSKKSLFYENVLSIYNNTFTTYSLRMIKGDTNKRFCVGKDTTLNKLEINDIKGLYYDVTLDNNNNIIDIKVKNKNYNISLSNSKGISKGDIKEDIINENEDDEFKCNGNSSGVTLKEAILRDNPTVSERTDFSVTNTENTTGIIYKTNKTEDGSEVYYYSGNTTNNWVKFGKYEKDIITYRVYLSEDSDEYKEYSSLEACNEDSTDCVPFTYASSGDDMYWRIIRTNEDESIRLLYSGISPDTTLGYIKESVSNVSYMSGTYASLENLRQNTRSSGVKTAIDKWYKDNLFINYDKYVSKSAVYCNDRSIGKGTFDFSSYFYFGAYVRLTLNNTPSYKCGANTTDGLFESTQAVADKFSASTTGGGNGQLTYPAALITADEVTFAGGNSGTDLTSPYAWYYTNSVGNSITGNKGWWTMSPNSYSLNQGLLEIVLNTKYGRSGYLTPWMDNNPYVVRPVISLSSCAKVTGSGTPTDPYIIDETNSKC